MAELPYLNLGCGSTFHEKWTNIDFVSSSKHVIAHNLLKGIPFPDNSFSFVYHSHVLEHMPKSYSPLFLKECYRVLKQGGILRVVVPDLEQIAINYIKYLNDSINKVPGAEKKYDWTMLELFDQLVRTKSGGEMLEYIRNTENDNDKFLIERNGREAEKIMKQVRNQPVAKKTSPFRKLLSSVYHFRLKETLSRLVLKKDYSSYVEGKFRNQGEIHQWMYDRYSLRKLLDESGFKRIEQKTAFESLLPEWRDYNLDGEDGIVRKPDSLFMEAIKISQ